MTNHVCIDCQGQCGVCESKRNHPAGKGRNPQVLPINDPVNHPTHYTSDPSGVECIQITRHRNFNIGNAFKYLWRAGLKDSAATVQDLLKAVFYIEDEIKRLGGSK